VFRALAIPRTGINSTFRRDRRMCFACDILRYKFDRGGTP
jgi:hypothetical protein